MTEGGFVTDMIVVVVLFATGVALHSAMYTGIGMLLTFLVLRAIVFSADMALAKPRDGESVAYAEIRRRGIQARFEIDIIAGTVFVALGFLVSNAVSHGV